MTTDSPVHIHAGYLPGAIGRVTEMHARYYATHAGFGAFFESKVASGLAEFVPRLGTGGGPGLWLALQGERVVGSVAMDVEQPDPLAAPVGHLRWFILDDAARGQGVGRQLLGLALAHADTLQLPSSYLWTFSGLDAARYLYEAAGFRLKTSFKGCQWGPEVTEQRFVRPRPGGAKP